VAAGWNPWISKRGIDLAGEAVVEDLKKKSEEVTSNEEIASGVGTRFPPWRCRDRQVPRRCDDEENVGNRA